MLALALAAACSSEPTPPGAVDSGISLPTHDACLPGGERIDDATCLAVVADDGRMPTTSSFQAWADPPVPDVRGDDPEVAWLTAEAERCTCSCCHTTGLGGPGVHRWDLAYDGMWLDSASDWTLEVFAGLQESENQALPTDDPARLTRAIQAELDRRALAREAP
jgi:hypothetical protein